MKKSNSLTKKYLEAIIYCGVIIFSVIFHIFGTFQMRTIPILFILGFVCEFLFNRKYMTTVFAIIGSIVLVQIKAPNEFAINLIAVLEIGISVAFGEVCGKFVMKIGEKSKQNERKNNVKEILLALFMIGIFACYHILVNGNYFDYLKCKEKLNIHLQSNYEPNDRFEITYVDYKYHKKAQYIFSIEDKLEDKFFKLTVYPEETMIEDKYKNELLTEKKNELNEVLSQLINEENTSISGDLTDEEILNIKLYREVDIVNDEIKEEYAKDIVKYIRQLQQIKEFNNINQIDIILDSKDNIKDSVAISMDIFEYIEIEKTKPEEAFKYIIEALKMEYFD